MAFAPLKLAGNKKIDGTDVSEQVIAFNITGTADTIEVPATFGARKTFFKGDDSYEVEIEFLTDVDAAAITQLLYTQLADVDGFITIAGTVRPGAVSATNPEWQAEAVVTDFGGIGGTVNEIGRTSVRLPLRDRPTQATS